MDDENWFGSGAMEIFLEALGGKPVGKAIEDQEKREQQKMIAVTKLPKSFSMYSGEKLSVRKCYEKLGIKIVKEYDDLFYDVELPEGWKIKATNHSMWSKLLDEKGRERASIFYKGAFYDRDAFISFLKRYTIKIVDEDDYRTNMSYEKRQNLKHFGVVYDCDKEIFRTKGIQFSYVSTNEFFELNDARASYLIDKCKKFLDKKGITNFEDRFAYWD